MADHYLEFSEILANLSPDEVAWLRDQLKIVHVFDGKEYTEEEIPKRFRDTAPEWSGCRVFRDMKDYDPDVGEGPGCEHRFCDDDQDGVWETYLWLYAIEGADLERVAHLIQRFLKKFRSGDCWSLTYAATCSKPRAGEFGGGAMFVTADEVKWQNAHDFVETHSAAHRKKTAPDSTCSASAIQSYDLRIGGPDLRTQREMLRRLGDALHGGTRPQLAPDDVEPLEGLINLTDAIADQAADDYGIDCLFPVSEGSDTGDVEDESRQERKRLIRQAEATGVRPEQLDELVHEMASSHAASINNGGLSEQIEYLVRELGAAEVERILSGFQR